ncbi:MAG: hypothetical protein Q7T15_08700 [Microcella sp.]|uniref:hypothetical protein n=1 Tax=Microcella sp. TaxID=1913979 RepID=UPI0027192339|nr:hypothetical protein [Microcella sp.]MDO8338318.1 hypothetical protein [Microcella sp.]
MSQLTAPSGRTVHLTDADGTVRDWLVSPAWALPCDDLEQFLPADGEPWGERRRFSDGAPSAEEGRWVLTQGPDAGPLKERLLRAHALDVEQPLPTIAEGDPIAWSAFGMRHEGFWRRVHTGWDGYLDWSAFCFTPEYRASVASTVLEADQAEWRTFELHTTGPFALWVDGELVLRGDRVSYMEPEVHSVRLRLHSRTTTIHLATWQVAFREVRHVARLRVIGLPVRVVIPSRGADETAARLADGVLSRVGSPSWAQEGATAILTAPAGMRLRVRVGDGAWQHVQADAHGRAEYSLLGAVEEEDEGADVARSAGASMLSTGESIVEVGVADDRCPQTVRLRIASLPQDSRLTSEGSPESWRRDVLAHVGADGDDVREAGVAGVLARFALDPSTMVSAADLTSARHRVATRGDCADFEIIALLLAWHWIPAEQWDEDLREEVRAELTGMKYWITQPGLDAMCYFTENHQFVWHVAQALAGEAFAETRFSVDGRTGREHAAEGRARAAAWIARKLEGGFSEFDSNAYLAIDSYALVALIELAQDQRLTLSATTLLDKTLVSLTSNSWRGIHGAAHGRSYVHTLRSSRYEETSPLLRLIGGVGTLNDAVLPVTALALAKRYEIPAVVRELARTEPEEWDGRQVYRGALAFERDLLARPYRSDLRIHRTPEVMLASVQDYRSGLPGLQEHIWGATLGRELQVFVTHPANADTGSAARPNAWAGHRVLGRVHQHRNALLHVQRFTTTDPRRNTHLWFPPAQFDEIAQRGDWLFGRRGRGFVAVAAEGGVRAVAAGDTAQQEWIPRAGGAAWIAVVGRHAVDGDFADWVERLAASETDWRPLSDDDPGVRWESGDHPSLELSFDGPFLVGGRPVGFEDGRIEDEPHIHNPAVTLRFGQPDAVVEWAGETLRLDVAGAITTAKEVAAEHGR